MIHQAPLATAIFRTYATTTSPPTIQIEGLNGIFPFSGTSPLTETGTAQVSLGNPGYMFPDAGIAFDSNKFPAPGNYPFLFRITLTVGNTKYSVDPEMVICDC